ncbi:phosphoadenylyl-sulfate reductase [Halovulum dunhuangense]|uniref:Adenosine 5'-phosphosulfate reductase n=1 Tax=Halovulum dunhuangense TaxID=1505036 RepID=A0A849KVR0_9RHOB|nr:phosphoadenylyl-sulfate reductase [Halovulum dunhuangense]NNU79195.1 phosphoadenylyl-sulfate reductase [Halovulum dunhuangense]
MLLEPSIRFTPDLAVAALNTRYEGAPADEVLHAALRLYAGRIAVVSSFGAESAVLLHMLAQINPHAPVLMIDTLMLFPETLDYQRRLGAALGLTDVHRITPDAGALSAGDPWDALHLSDPDACCRLRKVAPLSRALAPFEAHVNGRKRYQSGTRARLRPFEQDAGGAIKVNPLADWGPRELAAYMDRHALPRHPLVARGYASIGCAPCTTRVAPGEDTRAGRWRGRDKTECGIHFGPDGRAERKERRHP